MEIENFKKAQELIQDINRLKIIEQQMGVVFEEGFTIMNSVGIKINADNVIASFFPYAQRDLSEENYAAIKNECNNFITNSQAVITNLRKEKENQFKEL